MPQWSLWDMPPEEVAVRVAVLDVVVGAVPAWAWALLDQALAARSLVAQGDQGAEGGNRRVIMTQAMRRPAHSAQLIAVMAVAAPREPAAAAALHDLLEETGAADAITAAPAVETPPLARGSARTPRTADVARVRHLARRRRTCDLARLGEYQAQVLGAVFGGTVRAGADLEVPLPISVVHGCLSGGPPATRSASAALSRALAALDRRGLLVCRRQGGRYITHLSLTSAGWRVAQELMDRRP